MKIGHKVPKININMKSLLPILLLSILLPIQRDNMPGDVNGDDQINIFDILIVLNWIIIEYEPTDEELEVADISQNGSLDILDIVLIVNCILYSECWEGCADQAAINYTPGALVDDGTCEYLDIDGNLFGAIVIGEQRWMNENLKVTHYQNGDEIPGGFSDDDWANLHLPGLGAYAIYPYNEDEESWNTCEGDCSELYGLLYNWYAVMDDRGICPEGWHVPSDEEWMGLEMTLGMSFEEAQMLGYRGTNEGSKLAGISELWADGSLVDNEEFGTSGFIAIPGGHRDHGFGHFGAMGDKCYFWSSTSSGGWSLSRCRVLYYSHSDIKRSSSHRNDGNSVRCVRD